MADQRLRIRNFGGGLSEDDIFGPSNSSADAVTVDFRKSPGRLSLMPALTTEVSGNSFLGPHSYDAVRINDSSVYFANGNYTYKRTFGANGASGTYAEETASSAHIASADLDYRPDIDALFLFSSNTIHELSPLSNSPTYKIDKYSSYSMVKTFTTDAISTNTYTLPTTITEAGLNDNTNIFPFNCTLEPLNRLQFLTDTLGTGDWTLTIHDSANNTLATQTILNANMPPSGDVVTFDSFTGTDRLSIGLDYHVHLTVSTGTSKVCTVTASDLSTAYCAIFANRLVSMPASVGHCTHQLGAKTYFCNERYIGEWEFLDISGGDSHDGYDAHRVELPANYKTVSVSDYSEYLAVGCAIGGGIESGQGNIASGQIIFWNTTDSTFDFVVDVPQGVPEGLFSHNNRLYFVARGRLYYWAGGDVIEVFEFPGVDQFIPENAADAPKLDTYLGATRHCMTSHDGLLHVGYPAQTANTNVRIGIYSFGRNKSILPEAMSFDYVTCNGHTTTAFNTALSPDMPTTGITLLKDFGGTMLCGWTYDSTTGHGIDRLNDTNALVATGSWRSFWFDNGDPDIQKTPKAIKVTFAPLAIGCTVTPFVQYDYSGTDVQGTDSSGNTFQGTAGDIDVVYPLDANSGFYNANFGINLASSAGNNIEVLSLTFKFDDNHSNDLATENSANAS